MASNENRGTFRLLSYWKEACGEQNYPSINDISVGEMGDLWDMCFIINFQEGQRGEIQHFGSGLIEIFGKDYTGAVFTEISDNPILVDINQSIEEMMLMQAPSSHCATVEVEECVLRYRSLVAPLSSDGEVIDFLVGTTNFKRYGES